MMTKTTTATTTATTSTSTAGLGSLSNELLKDILDQIGADPDRSVNIDRRAYLSVESFRPPSPPPPLRAQDIGNFRLVCRRFAELGAPHQFTRIATRFSRPGLQRLERICSRPHLAKHTKKFSYLIPDFYVQGRERVGELLLHSNGDLHALDASYFEKKAEMQRNIVGSGEDLRILKKAMTAFRSLQHVQILRLQDEADRALLDYLGDSEEDWSRIVDLKWAPACTHAARTMAEALAHARSPVSRFSGPMMNVHSALAFQNRVPKDIHMLAERLTCLELHFEDGPDSGSKFEELSRSFRNLFLAAKNMQAVHVGFPSRRPLEMRLEQIFNNVHWEKLRAFGVQAWRLDASEIIDLARRHRKTLRGLRLRDVQLREGSMWKDVLRMLREEMELLEWVSLRRIDYSAHFDEMWAGSMEVPDYPPGTGSESDDEDDFHSHVSFDSENFENGATDADIEEEDDTDDDDDGESTPDTDEGPDANELALSPNTPSSLPFCTCSRSSYPASADDLGDDGHMVVYQQRKLWEKWVIGRCPEHSTIE